MNDKSVKAEVSMGAQREDSLVRMSIHRTGIDLPDLGQHAGDGLLQLPNLKNAQSSHSQLPEKEFQLVYQAIKFANQAMLYSPLTI